MKKRSKKLLRPRSGRRRAPNKQKFFGSRRAGAAFFFKKELLSSFTRLPCGSVLLSWEIQVQELIEQLRQSIPNLIKKAGALEKEMYRVFRGEAHAPVQLNG